MNTPPEDPDAYRDDHRGGYQSGHSGDYGGDYSGDHGGDFGSPYGQSPYAHGSGYPGAQPGPPSPGAQSPYPYGLPPQFGMPSHYGLPPQYGAAPAYGAMQPYAPGYPVPAYPVPGYPVSRREPALSLVLSFFLPGLGTIVNGQAGKGVAIMGGYFLGVLLSIILIGIPIMMGFWIWGLVDAYRGAQAHNARHGFH